MIPEPVQTLAPIEIELGLPCQACHCHGVFTAFAPERAKPRYLRCIRCGAERLDLTDFCDALAMVHIIKTADADS
jgi:hypothetical protein